MSPTDDPRHGLSRRRFLQTGAVAAGAVVGAGHLAPLEPRHPDLAAGGDKATARTAGAVLPDTAGAAAAVVDRPPPQQLVALSVAPPGQSGFFSLEGQVAGDLTHQPGSYGAHVDDQRLMYWTFGYKPAAFATPSGIPERPTPGSRLYRDPHGVPLIYGDTVADLWFAAGWAFAQDRLFEMDGIRRLALGTLAELTGPSAVPGDVQARVLGYDAAEYDAMFTELLDDGDRTAIDACVAGINAWLDQVLTDPVQYLPAEYALLQTLPRPWDRRDLLASGVLIVRSVATAGGNEMGNVANLVSLQQDLPVDQARGAFEDLFWLQDTAAVTTVPASSGLFPNSSQTPAQRRAAFEAMADYAQGLPAELADGPGTGAYPAPGPLGPLSAVLGELQRAGPSDGVLQQLHGRLPAVAQAGLERAAAAVAAWGRSLHGGSYQFAVSPDRSATGHALLVSGPQLGYSYPSELYELEVHGPGVHARGATVPGLPVVGIGMGTRIAWALTTGESKTIDSFIETTRPGRNGGPPQYLFDGTWRDQQCRQETVAYRLAPDGVPVGPPAGSVTVTVCRTHHGPIVATAPAGPDGTAPARSVAYAIWGREVQTLSGVAQWNRATTFEEFAAGVAKVTWNENALYADADGTIAYWHPGLYPVRSPLVDIRFPTPGTGGYEWQGFLPFEKMPHAVNPAQGYLANWNTKPAVGWLEEAGTAPGQPAGAFQRVQDVTDQIVARIPVDLADLAAIDRFIGVADHRARSLLPLVLALRAQPGLTAPESEALATLATWNRHAYLPPPGVVLGEAPGTTDGPAPTIFAAVVEAVYAQLFAHLPAAVVAVDNQFNSLHVFDVEPLLNLAMRVLDPATSALPVHGDYLAGRRPDQVLLAALDQAIAALTAQYGTADQSRWRRPHPTSSVCSLTGGVIGPCLSMPFEDRGTYIHHVAFT